MTPKPANTIFFSVIVKAYWCVVMTSHNLSRVITATALGRKTCLDTAWCSLKLPNSGIFNDSCHIRLLVYTSGFMGMHRAQLFDNPTSHESGMHFKSHSYGFTTDLTRVLSPLKLSVFQGGFCNKTSVIIKHLHPDGYNLTSRVRFYRVSISLFHVINYES